MKRDARGRFVDRRAHEYELAFDDGSRERIYALSASEAVAERRCLLLPRTITDKSVMHLFAAQQAGGTPMLDRMYGRGWWSR